MRWSRNLITHNTHNQNVEWYKIFSMTNWRLLNCLKHEKRVRVWMSNNCQVKYQICNLASISMACTWCSGPLQANVMLEWASAWRRPAVGHAKMDKGFQLCYFWGKLISGGNWYPTGTDILLHRPVAYLRGSALDSRDRIRGQAFQGAEPEDLALLSEQWHKHALALYRAI